MGNTPFKTTKFYPPRVKRSTRTKTGALVVAIVNDARSPLARAADIVLDMQAGPELAVAATKSFLCTLTTFVRLVAAITPSPQISAAQQRWRLHW